MTITCNANNWTKYNNVTFLKECHNVHVQHVATLYVAPGVRGSTN